MWKIFIFLCFTISRLFYFIFRKDEDKHCANNTFPDFLTPSPSVLSHIISICGAAMKPCLHSDLTVWDYAQCNSQRTVSPATLGSGLCCLCLLQSNTHPTRPVSCWKTLMYWSKTPEKCWWHVGEFNNEKQWSCTLMQR